MGRIEFNYDTNNDLIIAYPFWKIVTEEDCIKWYKQWTSYLNGFNRKMDCIIVLDHFVVDSSISSIWGFYRSKITTENMRFSYRVNVNLATGVYIKTSGVNYNSPAKDAESIESAIEAIMEERKMAGV
jgi:hypothetical protein